MCSVLGLRERPIMKRLEIRTEQTGVDFNFYGEASPFRYILHTGENLVPECSVRSTRTCYKII